jgi:hypothetical protein
MSALGQKEKSRQVGGMSALPPKGDIGRTHREVRFVPKADILRRGKTIGRPRDTQAITESGGHSRAPLTIRLALTQEQALVLSLPFYDGHSRAW